ncbi:MAG: CHAT domain-containing protein [Myxococcota bacterium]
MRDQQSDAPEQRTKLTAKLLVPLRSALRGSSRWLVVLSACDTGTGLQNRGQEVQGHRWGFRAAGAKSLVTSLWLSNDVVTQKLMRSIYEVLVAKSHGSACSKAPRAFGPHSSSLSRTKPDSNCVSPARGRTSFSLGCIRRSGVTPRLYRRLVLQNFSSSQQAASLDAEGRS